MFESGYIIHTMANLQLVPNQLDDSKKVFAIEKELLLKLLNNFWVQVEHIGSTALPNSLTKPVLDILLIAQTHQDQEQIATLLVKSGYSQGELDREQTKLFFYKPISEKNSKTFIDSIHLHLAYQATPNQNDTISIKIRDYLLSHTKEVEAYNAEKQRLAEVGNYDRGFYVVNKEPYIKKIIEKLS
jgi:GrpB-like predicted nucleotidyltransferase (UPF0157 family)